jgi:pimeloyl-ACP methyl ester carboxylesterase
MQKSFRAGMVIACCLLGASAAAGDSGISAQSGDPHFDAMACPFTAEETAPYRVTCGTVSVTENRGHDDGRRIRLAVAIVHAQSSKPAPDPVIYLDGGPGQSSMALVVLRLKASVRVREILKTRDVIFWDQRGVGLSTPHLCTTLDTAWFHNLLAGYSVDEQRRHNLEVLRACSADLKREGIDIAQFGTATSAADLEDVRRALRIHTWNLDGGSYGTRLGLVAMRDAPAAVRSVLLDGVMPINAPHYIPQAWRFSRVIKLLDARCRADQDCHARFPELENRVYRLLAQLREHPRSISVTPGPSFPVDHVIVNDRTFALALYGAFYDTSLIPVLPAVIEQIERGNDATFEAMANSILSGLGAIRQSLNLAVDCHDALPQTSVTAIHESNAAFPSLADAFQDDESWPAYCAAWNSHGASPEELLPTASNIPTLLLVGDFDQVTPPEYADLARQTLSASTLVELKSAGHGGKSYLPCVAEIELGFLSNPTAALDTRCAQNAAQVPFVTRFLLLPGLTRLLLGMQTGSHILLLTIAGLAILLPLLCLLGIACGPLYRRMRGRQRPVPLQPSAPRRLVLGASLAILCTAAVMAYDCFRAFMQNPNVLLLGLPGRPIALMIIGVASAGIAVITLVACLRRMRVGWRSPLNWLGAGGSFAYLLLLAMLAA